MRELVLTCLVLLLVESSSLAAEKPNMLFLLSDDHSYPFLSCYGDSNVNTPTYAVAVFTWMDRTNLDRRWLKFSTKTI